MNVHRCSLLKGYFPFRHPWEMKSCAWNCLKGQTWVGCERGVLLMLREKIEPQTEVNILIKNNTNSKPVGDEEWDIVMSALLRRVLDRHQRTRVVKGFLSPSTIHHSLRQHVLFVATFWATRVLYCNISGVFFSSLQTCCSIIIIISSTSNLIC